MKISLRSLFVACLIAPVAFTYASELQEMKIVLLGTKGGPSLLKADRLPMATALIIGNKTWLIDAGYGASLQLVKIIFHCARLIIFYSPIYTVIIFWTIPQS